MRAAAEPGRDMRAAVELMITNPQGERVRWTGQFYRLTGPPARRRLVLETPVDLRGIEERLARLEARSTGAEPAVPEQEKLRL